MTADFGKIDPLSKDLGTIVVVETADDRFAARLIAIQGNELWFESKKGKHWMKSRTEIISIRPGLQVPREVSKDRGVI
jgi:hypothetical protein